MTHNGANPAVLDYAHFPGDENPITHPDVMTTESVDGITAHDVLGYAAPLFDRTYTGIETLDQHDVMGQAGVPTPSGVDHANPRGPVTTDGTLDIPESGISRINLQDVIHALWSVNASTVGVRMLRPARSFNRTITLGSVNDGPTPLVRADDDRYRMTVTIGSAGTVLFGSFEEVASGQGFPLVWGNPPKEFHHTDEIWAVISSGTNVQVSWSVELYDRQSKRND